MMSIQAETCSATEDYEQVCESERIINKKQEIKLPPPGIKCPANVNRK
jgi:hypothetical protein